MRRGSASASDSTADPFEEHAEAPVELQPKEIDLSGAAEDKLPNTLVITVIQARALQPSTLRSTLSCYVKLSSLGREYKTSVISKSDEPYWNESFSFRAVDWASSVTLSVRDKINVKVRVLGHVQISSADIANLPGMACQSWFRLRDKSGEKREGAESEIELKVALVYTKKNDPSIASADLGMAEQDTGVAMGAIVDQDDETEEEAFARRKELERQERERKSTLYSNLKQGDYQIQVHVIEARDLKGENLSGTSDPYCQVEVMGMKKKTSTKYETLGCVFDEILFFHFKDIGRNELKQASIKIAVWDKEKLMKDNFIGAYQLDCLSVYFRPHHELYRQWIAIHDNVNVKDRGVQGFLLVSINVIGPGDSFLVHDREAEVAKEFTATASSPLGASSTLLDNGHSVVLMPPTIDLKLHYLLVKVYKAEDLPAMDEGGLVLSSGIDAFVQIGFATNSACKSSVITVKGNGNLSPEFMEEMWIPVLAPTLSRNIMISVWDRDLGRKDELVGIASHDYQQVRSSTCSGGILASMSEDKRKMVLDGDDNDDGEEKQELEIVELRWFNLYGPPLRRVNTKRALMVSQNPEFGSTYRGRVLLSMERVESPMPSESEKFHTKRMKDATSSTSAVHPVVVKYTLRCALFCGADIPQFQSIASAKTKMRVTISIGSYEMHFDPQSVRKDGSVNWEEFKEKWPIQLPADLTQIPDVIITLSRQLEKDDFVGVSFARVLAADFLVKGFTSKCEWIHLNEDISRRQTKYALDKSQSSGSVLMRIGFGREEISVRQPWGDELELFAPFKTQLVHREIRVHIYQFRKLVLSDDKPRLPNPFVSVACCGQKKKTAPKYKTLDPLFYESMVFTVYVPQDVVFTPDLVFQLHDANVSTSTEVPSAVLGEFTVPMMNTTKSVVNASPPRPTWFNLQSRSSNASSSAFIDEVKGEALISIQFIDHPGPIERLNELEPLTPEYQDADLEIAALGIRKLKALGVMGVQHPHMEFELIGGFYADGTSVRKSKPSSATSNAKNANFLDFMRCPAKLPVDTLYAPQLRVKVCESSLGGLRKTTIASCVVDLNTKLPWSVEYVPPQQQRAFENPGTAPAFVSSAVDSRKKSRFKMRFPVLKISKKRRATGIQELAGEDDEQDDILSGEEESSVAEGGGKSNDNEDDGIGIGELKVPQVSLSRSALTGSRSKDPALLKQMKNGTQRRYLAAQADMLRGGVNDRRRGGGENTLHNASSPDIETSAKPAPYLDGRDWWITEYGGEELENFLKVKALETYPLYRSVLTRPSLLKRKRVRTELKAGLFKGLILVTERKRKATVPVPAKAGGGSNILLDLERLKEPQSLVVHVYILRGSSLQSKDANGYSDPYLRLKLGKQVISDRANYKKKTLNPEFFRTFTFNTTLPGPSQLEISVWDHDLVLDDLIGTTTVDLEDRWFHKDWQRIGQSHPKLKDAGGCLKPIEYRHLYTPKRTTSQGFIQLWIDILTAQQAAILPPVSIEPPAPKKFEVRVVVWRAENITDKDHSEVNDYFVKVWMEGGKAETTDVHWRCSNGKPCWNWRFKLPVEYPLRTPEFGRLHIQLWDKDVLKWNDILGEAQLDLYKWIRRAYESNRIVTPFLELKAMANASTQDDRSAIGQDQVQVGAAEETGDPGEPDDDDDDDGDDDDDSAAEDFGARGSAKENHSLLRNQKKKKTRINKKSLNKAKLPFTKSGFLTKPPADSVKKAKQAKEQAEAKAALNGLLDFMGLGALPDDAEWITIFYTDRESAVSMDMGRIGISVQIVPQLEAEANTVGKGRDTPNLNPYLPPPVGRMRLSANPFMMLKELIGPNMCFRITVLCCCVGCGFFIAVFGATIMSTLTYIQGMKRNENSGGGGNWRMPNMRFPPDFQDPRNTSVLADEGS